MAWTWGEFMIAPGETQNWWLQFTAPSPNYFGFQVIGVQPLLSDGVIHYTTTGIEKNEDGTINYYLTLTCSGDCAIFYHFCGNAI